MLRRDRRSFAVSAENPTGQPDGGTRGRACEKLRPDRRIEPGETITVADLDGPGMITHMWFGGFVSQHFILRIYWDGCEFPSVEAPLASFFGYHFPITNEDVDGRYPAYSSSEMMVAPCKGCNCYLAMPFRKHCRMTVENRSTVAKDHYWTVSGWRGPLEENEVEYLHAAFRQEHPVRPGEAYTVLDHVAGPGRFHGITLGVSLNGPNGCWVEGEPKMWIDGETYPSVNYTGTEDYFGGSYAFGNDAEHHHYQTYTGLYAGVYAILGASLKEQYNAQTRFMLYRWHVRDPIYFGSGFRMTLDPLGGGRNAAGVGDYELRYDDYTTTAYYYLEKPSPLPFELPDDRAVGRR